MQSLNEELQTVNAELQAKVDELVAGQQRHEEPAQQHGYRHPVSGQRAQRAAVHPRGDQNHQADPGRRGPADHRHRLRPALPGTGRRRAGGAADAGLSRRKQITTRDGRWFTVRIMPYRTLEDRIDGVVITFADITAAKTLEAELRKTQAGLHKQIGEQALKLER